MSSTDALPAAQPDWFSLANVVSTLLLGSCFVLVAQIAISAWGREAVKRRDRQVILLLTAVRAANTGLDAFLSDGTTTRSSALLFATRCFAGATRTAVLLFLVQHISSMAVLRFKWQAVFASSMAALAAFAGGLPIWAGWQMIMQGRGEEMLVELEGLAGVAAGAIVLLVFTVVLFRAAASKLVYTSMATLLVLQSAESLFWTVQEGWTWVLSLPLSNAYLLVLLLVTLPALSTVPIPLPTFPTIDSYTTLPSPKSSPRSKTVAIPPPPPLPQEDEGLDTLGSRWSIETDKKKGLKTILKNATPAARRGGHRRGGAGEESAVVMLDLQGSKEAQQERVHFAPTPQPATYPQQQQHAPLTPKPSFRSLLRSPSATVAGSLAPSPASSFSSDGATIFSPPQPQSQPQHPPRLSPSRSQTYPPMPILPTPPPLAPPLPTQKQGYQLPLQPMSDGNLFNLYTTSFSHPPPPPRNQLYPAPPPTRLVNPYSPVFPYHTRNAEGGGAELDRAASSSSSLIEPARQKGRRIVAWKKPE